MHFLFWKCWIRIFIDSRHLFYLKQKSHGRADDRVLSQTYDNNETLKSMYFCYICSWTPGILNLLNKSLIYLICNRSNNTPRLRNTWRNREHRSEFFRIDCIHSLFQNNNDMNHVFDPCVDFSIYFHALNLRIISK